jgi:hypothetical protein
MKVKPLLVASSIALMLNNGSTFVLADTEPSPDRLVTNISDTQTIFKGKLESNKSYEIINNDTTKSLNVSFQGYPNNLWMYNVAIYDANGKLTSVGMEFAYPSIQIPAGGKAILTVNSHMNYINVTMPISEDGIQPTVKESDTPALSIQKMDKENYYIISNNSEQNMKINIRVRDNYAKVKNIVIYDQNGVITDEYTDYLGRSFVIPPLGHALFISGVEGMSTYIPSSQSDLISYQSHPIGDQDIRKKSFELKLEESPYLIYKVVKITNTGGDNYFNLQFSSHIKSIKPLPYKLYLKSGESMNIIVCPTSYDFDNFNESITLTSGSSYSTKLPITFETPKINTAQPEVSEPKVVQDGNKEITTITSKLGNKVATYTFTLEKVDKNSLKDSDYKNTLVTTNYTDTSKEYIAERYEKASMLAYKGVPLSANDIVNNSYKITSHVTLQSKTATFVENYLVEKIFKYGLKDIEDLVPAYTNTKDCLADLAQYDQLVYLSETGQISSDMVNNYVDSLYIKKLNDITQTTLNQQYRDLLVDLATMPITYYMPQTEGIIALWQEAENVRKWAMAIVDDVWNENNAYWIGFNSQAVMDGYYDSFRYTDMYNQIHEVTAYSNTVISSN